jgi:hypothetical protein
MVARAASARPQEEAKQPRAVPTMADRKPVEGSTTCIVGCKLPNGIILQLSEMQDSHESMPLGGVQRVKIGRKIGEQFTLKGNRVPVGGDGQRIIPDYLILGGVDAGYALTHGIPREFMERWMDQNKDNDIVKNKMVIIANDEASIRSMAKENEAVKSGLEPLDPANPPRSIGRHSAIRFQKSTGIKSVDTVDE